jgi:four helix bundle protein
MHDITKLKIWQRSLDLADKIYNVTETFPTTERFGLISQMQRAAVSVGSNIAEGAGRNSANEFCHFLGIASGSANELRFHVEFSYRRKFISEQIRDDLQAELIHHLRMNYRLQERIREPKDRNDRSQAR